MPSNTDITHSFSNPLAKEYGTSAAIVLGYIGYRIRTSKNERDGKQWFYGSVDELSERYPYLGRTTVYEATLRLTAQDGPLIAGNFNKRKGDKTVWYAFRDDRILRQLDTEPRFFKAANAQAYGVAEAVLINNLAYWIAEKRKKDPDCLTHPMSPTTLAKHLPFSMSTIRRALGHLVEEGVFIPRPPSSTNQATEYALPTGSEMTVDESNTNEGVAESKTAPKSVPNCISSNPNQTLSKTNTTLSNPNTTLSNPDNVTILVDTPLKESCLEEESLKEDHFKASSVGFSSHTLSPDTALTSASPSSPLSDSGHNRFSEPIDGLCPATPGQAPVNVQDSSVKANDASCASSPSTLPVLLDKDSSLANNPAKKDSSPNFNGLRLPSTNAARYEQLPYYVFLDLKGVHKRCWEVMKFHNNNADPIYQDMADTIVGVARYLINHTDPAKIYALYQIKTQLELDAELHAWSGQLFAKVYDEELNTPDSPDNAHYREMFLAHSLCFLNMAFHSLKFDSFQIYLGTQYHTIAQDLFSRVRGWSEQQQAQRRIQAIEQRKIQFASPDLDKEANPNLSAPEKMHVLRQSLQARNRIGKYDEFGKFTEQVVAVTQNTPVLARQFFQLNPHYTVQHINLVIDACLALPANNFQDEEDPQWHARNGYKISLLLNSFTQVATQLNMLSQLPAFTPLPVEDEEADKT